MPPSPGAWGPLCNWLGQFTVLEHSHVSSQPPVSPASAAFQKVS